MADAPRLDDERWQPGMPVLARQEAPLAPADGRGRNVPQRVPETRPTPLQDAFIYLSVVVLICGTVAISAFELGQPLGAPIVRFPVLLGAILLLLLSADAGVRIARSARAWWPVDRGRALFRVVWVAVLGVAIVLELRRRRTRPRRVSRGPMDPLDRPDRPPARPAFLVRPSDRAQGPDLVSHPDLLESEPWDETRAPGGVPSWLAATLNYCSRCGAPLRLGPVEGEDRERLACSACDFIAYVNPRLVVTTLPVTEAGEVVLLRRGIEPGLGLWAQPGGFLEIDETVHEAAVRETLEEVGLIVEPGEIVGLYSRPEAAIVVIAFESRIVGGGARTTPEALEVRAFRPEAIPWPEIAFRTSEWALRDWLRRVRPDLHPRGSYFAQR